MSVDQQGQLAAHRFTGVVALDGPAGTGKSTVARRLAERLHAQFLDTGAMYRAATVAVLEAGADPADQDGVIKVVAASRIGVSTDPVRPHTTLNGRNVDTEIRTAETTAAVSAVSAVPAVRSQLVALQREILSQGATVAEGRDVGSVVWPDAELKVYLTASEAVRASRRAGELGESNLAEVAERLRRRDALDSGRAASPLRRTADAIELDTSELDIDQVVQLLVELALTGRRSVSSASSTDRG